MSKFQKTFYIALATFYGVTNMAFAVVGSDAPAVTTPYGAPNAHAIFTESGNAAVQRWTHALKAKPDSLAAVLKDLGAVRHQIAVDSKTPSPDVFGKGRAYETSTTIGEEQYGKWLKFMWHRLHQSSTLFPMKAFTPYSFGEWKKGSLNWTPEKVSTPTPVHMAYEQLWKRYKNQYDIPEALIQQRRKLLEQQLPYQDPDYVWLSHPLVEIPTPFGTEHYSLTYSVLGFSREDLLENFAPITVDPALKQARQEARAQRREIMRIPVKDKLPFVLAIYHPTPTSSGMDDIAQRWMKLIQSPKSASFNEDVARWHYRYTYQMPFQRGAAAIGEWMLKILYGIHDEELVVTPSAQTDFPLDQVAFSMTEDEYVAEFKKRIRLQPMAGAAAS